MANHLTVLDKNLDELVRQTPIGCAFWAGTCPDPKRTCGQCGHFDLQPTTRKRGCSLYTKQTRTERPLSEHTAACKYFIKAKKQNRKGTP